MYMYHHVDNVKLFKKMVGLTHVIMYNIPLPICSTIMYLC